MGEVTAHFEFSGMFWALILAVLLVGAAFYWRDELRVVVERMRQAQGEENND